MSQRRRAWILAGLGSGLAVGAAALALAKTRQQRRALARRVPALTDRAISRLPVPAESTFLRVNGLRLHAVLAGPEDGPLAVLLHGFPECWYSWRHQIAALGEAGYRVVAADQRGYNLSDKPPGVASYQIDHITADILGLIHAMGYEQATLVAHDWGGVAAWHFAMDYPQIVDRLVVMNAPHPVAFARELRNNRSQQLKSWYVAAFQLPWLPETLLALSPRATTRLFLRRTAVRPGAFSDADLEVMAAALAQPGAMPAMIHWYRAALRYPAARRSQVIACPTLLIWAEDDVALGLELTHGLARWVPDLQIHTIPGCGHWVQNEMPQEVNAQLLAFLAETG
ncbi:MAG: alpha/beta hydrolase [Anaerolineae bacterium]